MSVSRDFDEITPGESAPVFADPDTERRFRSVGFATVPVLPTGEVERLAKEITRLYPDGRTGITFANVDEDRAFMKQVSDLMQPVWETFLTPLVPGQRVAFTTCVVKHPGDASSMSAHDDGTFVDPAHHRSATLWVALTDCLEEDRNGMICVIPHSHRLISTSAGSNVPDWHRPYRQFLTDHLEPVPTRAGEAVVWDSRLLHGSPPNESDRPRIAVVAELVPRDAPLIHVQAINRSKRRMLEVDSDFHLEHSPIAVRHQMPPYPEVARFVEEVATIAPEQVGSLCGVDDVPVPVVSRPADDWFAPTSSAVGPQAIDSGTVVGGHPADDWCESAFQDVSDALARRPEVLAGRFSGFVDRVHGEWSGVEIVRDGAIAAAGAGFPRTEALARGAPLHAAALLVLPGGSSASLAPGEGQEFHIPLTMPVADAGIATAGGVQWFEFGLPVQVDRSVDRQFWNSGPDDLRWLVIRPRAASSESRARRFGGSLRRALRARSRSI